MTKKVWCTGIIVLGLTITGFSQMEKVNLMTGGLMSYGDEKTHYVATFSPSVSWFLSDRFVAGITLPCSHSDTKGLSFVYETISSFSIGPTLRYYFPIKQQFFPIMRQWAIFPQVDYTYGWQTVNKDSDQVGDSGTFTSSSSFVRLGFGATYFISRSMGLEGLISWQSISGNSAARGPSTTLGLGLQIYLAK